MVQTYNDTVHRSTGLPPSKTTTHDAQDIWLRQNIPYVQQEPRFKKGDHVFITRDQKTFDKGRLTLQ